jgi:7,8-dihydropterin-6-yl-methyl-4-(beta-D-ribofuranosyl)aminobenzene 5'-phosphate synthase
MNGRLRRYLIRIPPGIMGVIKRAKALIARGIRLVMGGYHLFSAHEWEIMKVIEAFEESGVERVCPCHCTGDSARSLFRESYGEKYVEGDIQLMKFANYLGSRLWGFWAGRRWRS